MSHEHPHGHGHGHPHGLPGAPASRRHRRAMVWVLLITVSVVGVQVAGALVSGSLALLADAGHMLTDATGVAIALLAGTIAMRPASDARTYGWQRTEILAALANALLLAGIAIWVIVTALGRWPDPPEVATGVMLAAALLGGAANAVSLLLLRRGAAESLNVRGAYLEVLADLLGSAAVVVAAVVIMVTGWVRADVVASLVVGAMILPRAWALLRAVGEVLLEATPAGMDIAQVREHVLGVQGVVGVHDLHAWTITSGVPVLSAHVVVDEACIVRGRTGEVLDRLSDCLAEHFDLEHSTLQIEPAGHREHERAHHR